MSQLKYYDSGSVQWVNAVVGAQGVQGTTGIQGSVGNQGTIGNTGSQGVQGTVGVQGTTGSTGLQGTTGTTGSQGTTGTQGAQGIQGITGLQGVQGTASDKYATSSTSSFALTSTGSTTITVGLNLNYSVGQNVVVAYDATHIVYGTITSYTAGNGSFTFTNDRIVGSGTFAVWSVNLDGAVGIQGVVGPQGTTGTQGTTGIQGTQGITGSQGTTGSTGVQGTTGSTGSQGITGSTGIQGAIGYGAQGTTGTQGVTGFQGTTGSSASSAMTLIGSIYLGGSALVGFYSIPQTYSSLMLIGRRLRTASGGSLSIGYDGQANAVGRYPSSNYTVQEYPTNGTATGYSGAPGLFWFYPGLGNSEGRYVNTTGTWGFQAFIPEYTNTDSSGSYARGINFDGISYNSNTGNPGIRSKNGCFFNSNISYIQISLDNNSGLTYSDGYVSLYGIS
jgi:hypothetical protein